MPKYNKMNVMLGIELEVFGRPFLLFVCTWNWEMCNAGRGVTSCEEYFLLFHALERNLLCNAEHEIKQDLKGITFVSCPRVRRNVQ